jgi:acetyl-CoA/propionyl-CoA carboxylase biotin carboxyl carrier protein
VLGKVLIANRGEIAVRVLRTLKELGIPSVAIHSEADAGAPHVRLADEAYPVGPPPVAESYLNAEAILDVCRRTGADALHPGYGFLAENADFAAACRDTGVTFIGPSPEAIEAMGEKTAARRLVRALGIPVVPGTDRPVESPAEARAAAAELGYPVAVKAAGGGGGIGFRVARDADQLDAALESVAAEGARFFGSSAAYLERYFDDPRHVEVQILGDATGAVVSLGERDCSIQRRHQKLVEETPAPTVSDDVRATIGEYATAIARHIGYTSAGTIEGLLVGDDFYFLELNARLQVEHPVTELATGVDIVREQIRVAAGRPLSIEAVSPRGVAIECRINAEAAHKGFVPRPGTIETYAEPSGPGVRVDSGVVAGSTVTHHYDSLLAKVVVWDETREAATGRMLRALDAFELTGIETLLPFHRALLRTRQWREAETARDLLGDRDWLRSTNPPEERGGR